MMLRAAGVLPPMKFLSANVPKANSVIVAAQGYTIGRQANEVAFNPISMTPPSGTPKLVPIEIAASEEAGPENPVNERPRTTQLLPAIWRPPKPGPKGPPPSSWIKITALSPTLSVLGLAPGCVYPSMVME